MSDLWLKLRMLRFYGLNLREWWQDVGSRDAWTLQCCDGHMCGCMGSCWGDWWEYLIKEKRP